jgi:hypothetical protein
VRIAAAWILAFIAGALIFAVAFTTALSDAFADSSLPILVLVLAGAAYLLLSFLLGSWQPQAYWLLAIGLALPAVLVSAVLFVSSLAEGATRAVIAWPAVAILVLGLCMVGALLGARRQRPTVQ